MRQRTKSTELKKMEEAEGGGTGGTFGLQDPYVKFTCVNMLVFGIELTVSAGFSYLPPMLLKAGFGEVAMTWIMGIGPLLALLTIPFLGSWSDNCRSKFGRRKPFMLGFSLILFVSLIFISFGHLIPSIYIYLLVSGAVLLNYACQVGLNPCESVVADMTVNSTYRDLGFTIYSIMMSVGGCIGYLITAIDWSETPLQWLFLSAERTAFAFVLVCLLLSLLITLFVAVDKPLRRRRKTSVSKTARKSGNGYDDVGYVSAENDEHRGHDEVLKKKSSPAIPFDGKENCSRTSRFRICFRLQLTFMCNGMMRFGKLFMTSCLNLINVPKVLRLLFIADLCSWTALMCQLMYYTDFVGQKVYGGNPNAEEGTEQRQQYDTGVRMGSFGLLLHGILSSLYAITLQKYLLRRYGCRIVYILGLVVYTITMALTLFSNDIFFINLLAALSGTGFAAITTIPYMLISAYHSQPHLYFSEPTMRLLDSKADSDESLEVDMLTDESHLSSEEEDCEDSKCSRGFGADIAVIDAAYFLSQTILSLFIGYLVDLTRTVVTYIAVATVFGAISCYCTTRIIYPPHT